MNVLDRTCCYTGKFNVAFSLCGVLVVALYFSEGFSETVAEASQPLRVRLKSLFFHLSGIMVFVVMFPVAVIDNYC